MCFRDPQFRITRARACIYLLLSKLYLPGLQNKEVRWALGLLSECLSTMPDVFWTEKTSQDDFENLISEISHSLEEETAAFFCEYHDLLSASEEISPSYESFYLRPSARGKCLASIERLYTASGFSGFPSRQFADHISLELHYLHFLGVQEAEAIVKEEVETVVESRRKQATFLWKHLRYWIPGFSNSVQKHSISRFAALTAKAVELFIDLDAMYLSFLLANTTDLFTELDSISRSSSVCEKVLARNET